MYAGINPEKWTQGKPVRCQFDGLISVSIWNKANRDKFVITESGSEITITRRKIPEHLLNKGVKNSEFPYKRIVMCPECEKPLYGSASRGRHGGYYPAYHCDHRGHYFRKTKKEFDATIENFVKNLRISDDYIDALMSAVGTAFDKQLLAEHATAVAIDLRLTELYGQIRQSVDKIKFLNSETAIKYMEEDIAKLEVEIRQLEDERKVQKPQKPNNMEEIMQRVRYFLEHLDELLLHHCNPVLQAKYFGLIFNKAPTYADIVSGTPDCTKITEVNEVFTSASVYSKTHGWDGGCRCEHPTTRL